MKMDRLGPTLIEDPVFARRLESARSKEELADGTSHSCMLLCITCMDEMRKTILVLLLRKLLTVTSLARCNNLFHLILVSLCHGRRTHLRIVIRTPTSST